METLRRHFVLRIAVITAVALLFAQLGAMTHAYSHRGAADAPSAHQSTGGGHEICGDCLNYAPLLSAAGTPVPFDFVAPRDSSTAFRAEPVSRPGSQPLLAFRSRAPPVKH